MTKSRSIRIAALSALLFMAASCVFPYEVQLARDGELPLVFEGDINIGGMTTITVSHVLPLTGLAEDSPVDITGYIQSSDQSRAYGRQINNHHYSSSTMYSAPRNIVEFDTSTLPEGQKYLLHLDIFNQRTQQVTTFESDWLEATPTPVLDDLSFSCHPDEGELWIGLSMHCNGAHYFRWAFTEQWQYHSDINATVTYFPETNTIVNESPQTYYCWKTVRDENINVRTTFNQIEDRFEDLQFHTVPLTSRQIQMIYRIKLRLFSLDEPAYKYWQNMQQISQGQGSILSPTPSEMTSNVHCVTDPDLQVIGYLSAGSCVEGELYYYNEDYQYYIQPKKNYEITEIPNGYMDRLSAYMSGRLPFSAIPDPVNINETASYLWAPSSCVDCRLMGGSTTPPEDWAPYK